MTASVSELAGLRVAQLIESDGPGGAERVVVQLARTLQKAGASSVAFLPADGEGWLARELAGSGIAIEYFRVDRPVSPACARALSTAFRKHRIDVAHSHEFSMAVYGSYASWRTGVPHVITMHGSTYFAARLRRRLAMRAAIALSGQTVAVSNRLAQAMSRTLWVRESRIDTIANGVQYVRPPRTTLRHELHLGPDDRLLVSVGNLYPVKGHRHLIDALAMLAAGHPAVHLAISGRGELAQALAAQARDAGLESRVHLLGLRSDIPAILEAADIFVLPSLSEGLPLALLEAMFAGRPIVASDVGEIGFAVGFGQAGILVEPGNPGALARALDSILRDPNLGRELGTRAAARAAAEYDVTLMVRRYAATYRKLLRNRRPAIEATDDSYAVQCR
jgi:glycosyltransferase involved in cell wall biosynthesis